MGRGGGEGSGTGQVDRNEDQYKVGGKDEKGGPAKNLFLHVKRIDTKPSQNHLFASFNMYILPIHKNIYCKI